MRLSFLAAGVLALAGCTQTDMAPSASPGMKIGPEQRVLGFVSADDPDNGNRRVVTLPPADVNVGIVSAYNGGYPAATALAQLECLNQGGNAVRIPDDIPDGFVQFNCRPSPNPVERLARSAEFR